MIEVVSIKFKNRGKAYSFDPRGLTIKHGEKIAVSPEMVGGAERLDFRLQLLTREFTLKPLAPLLGRFPCSCLVCQDLRAAKGTAEPLFAVVKQLFSANWAIHHIPNLVNPV